ncbi:hypothetical protein Glove_59g103 [Diversispora epigaea]|uniref:HMG box domain-containing protein n=1 Tax=Diversispora epigaea TaxID=1348612 RepID=A0A397JFA7_9GLOM|nr:hypothetical protein Glove_59g103 [Diversispora epigaea]
MLSPVTFHLITNLLRHSTNEEFFSTEGIIKYEVMDKHGEKKAYGISYIISLEYEPIIISHVQLKNAYPNYTPNVKLFENFHYPSLEIAKNNDKINNNPKIVKNLPRPRNSFIIYCEENAPKIKSQYNDLSNIEISQLLGVKWRNLAPKQKKNYKEKVDKVKLEHKKLYPEYKYKPRKNIKRINKKKDTDNTKKSNQINYKTIKLNQAIPKEEGIMRKNLIEDINYIKNPNHEKFTNDDENQYISNKYFSNYFLINDFEIFHEMDADSLTNYISDLNTEPTVHYLWSNPFSKIYKERIKIRIIYIYLSYLNDFEKKSIFCDFDSEGLSKIPKTTVFNYASYLEFYSNRYIDSWIDTWYYLTNRINFHLNIKIKLAIKRMLLINCKNIKYIDIFESVNYSSLLPFPCSKDDKNIDFYNIYNIENIPLSSNLSKLDIFFFSSKDSETFKQFIIKLSNKFKKILYMNILVIGDSFTQELYDSLAKLIDAQIKLKEFGLRFNNRNHLTRPHIINLHTHGNTLKQLQLFGVDFTGFSFDNLKVLKNLEILSIHVGVGSFEEEKNYCESPEFFPNLKELELFNNRGKWHPILGESVPLIKPHHYVKLSKIIEVPQLSADEKMGAYLWFSSIFDKSDDDKDEEEGDEDICILVSHKILLPHSLCDPDY